MAQGLAIMRDEHTAAASRCRDSDVARRMLALGLVREGRSRAEAAQSCGMDRQTLRDWVHRYNDAGLAGLSDKKGRTGPKPRLSPEHAAEVAGIVRKGPEPIQDGVVRWRRVDLARVIKARFEVVVAERSVGGLLRRLGVLACLGPAAPCEGRCRGASVFRDAFSALVTAALPEAVKAAGTPVDIWRQDEARVGQQGTLTYVWADKGSRPATPQDLGYAPGSSTSGPTCSGRCAPSAAWARAWCCRSPTAR